MSTTYHGNKNLAVVESYYHYMLQKNFDEMEKCLDQSIYFISPLAEMRGKDAVVSAAKNLSQVLDDIDIRSKFVNQDQIMLAYDFMFSKPIVKLKSAALIEVRSQLICKIELFFDSKQFEKK